jgi:hypothetical protein
MLRGKIGLQGIMKATNIFVWYETITGGASGFLFKENRTNCNISWEPLNSGNVLATLQPKEVGHNIYLRFQVSFETS